MTQARLAAVRIRQAGLRAARGRRRSARSFVQKIRTIFVQMLKCGNDADEVSPTSTGLTMRWGKKTFPRCLHVEQALKIWLNAQICVRILLALADENLKPR
jgi:hypothetical protein